MRILLVEDEKPLSRAIADGDRIRAVIRSSTVNHGGRTNGYTVPSVSAQSRLLRRAWQQAGVEPDSIGYLEMHGTGTRLGDPIEVEAATRAMRARTDRRQFCAIGSVNITPSAEWITAPTGPRNQ